MVVLNCLFYPLLVPFTRYQVRLDNDIDGHFCQDLLAGWCWYIIKKYKLIIYNFIKKYLIL